MKTSGPTSGIPPVTASSARTAITQWQLGQLLQATVTENNSGKVLLAIGNRQVSAETSLSLQKGQQLSLEVRSLGAQPVLKILSAVSESVNAAAARLLLPQQGPYSPLLANINQLAQTTNPPVSPLINQLVRDMVKQLPDTTAVSNPVELKKAVENSGIFLESRLLQQAGSGGGGLTLNADFKANLLRLVHLVRNWPGSSPTAPAIGTASAPPGQGALPPTGNPPARNTAATPAQIGRVVLAAGSAATGPALTPASLAVPGASVTGTGGQPMTSLAGTLVPPPLPGTVPVPQAAAAASLDVLNRLGNLRTDLLQQIDAALARTQLQQLATLPREGERALLEWLLELPVRHGDAINLWSLRIFREPQDGRHSKRVKTSDWTVQLAVDLPGLGPMQIQVRLANEHVSTRFWTAREETMPLVREHLHELRQALLDVGLEVGELDCQIGSAPVGKPRAGEPLIREKA